MMCRLDEETDFMMYEPGERRGGPGRLKAAIEAAVSGGDLLLAAEDDGGDIAGFLWAERGRQNRIRHTAYIVIGIRRAYRGKGIGSELFRRLDEWAESAGIIRLELTVECPNTAALRLYEKNGFRVEGTRLQSMLVNGRLVDEYWMSKIRPSGLSSRETREEAGT